MRPNFCVRRKSGASFSKERCDYHRPHNVSVELYAEPIDDGRPVRISMRPGIALADKKAGNIYKARVEDDRPASDYTVRIVPSKAEALVPLEANLIAWHQS
jgi:starch phosphorylase